jgi:hypothetical protein
MGQPRAVLQAALPLLLAAAAAGAEPQAPAAPTGPVPAASPCSTGRASALSEIACELAAAYKGGPSAPLVIASPITTDLTLPNPERLSARIAQVVAGALGGGASASEEPARLGRARAMASRAASLVHLEVELSRGELRVVLNSYPASRGFWARVKNPTPSPTRHGFASRRIDAELRTFLPPVPLVAGRVERATAPDLDAVALGCGDTDADGSLELVWVGRRRIHLARVRGGRVVPVATANWTDLSPVAQSPLREPIGSVYIEPGKYIDIGLSDRAYAVRLLPNLQPLGKPGRRIPWPSGGCTRFNALVLRSEIEACVPGDPPPDASRFDWATDAVAGARLVAPDGKRRTVRAGRIANEANVVISDDGGQTARLSGAGAQLAVADLDGDGQPELLSTSDTLDPKADALIVHTWQSDGRLVERLRIGVPTGVQAIAVCPPESAGVLPIALATADGLWIVR